MAELFNRIIFDHVMLTRTHRNLAAGAFALAMLAGACAVQEAGGSLPPALETTSTTVLSSPTPVSSDPSLGTTVSSLLPTDPPTTLDEPPKVESTVNVDLADYAISVEAESVPAGLVTLSVVNHDSAPHNVVLLATELPVDQLPTTGIRVDEASAEIKILARTPTLEAGSTASLTASLTPGRYILVCTVPHHYVRELMVAVLTVS